MITRLRLDAALYEPAPQRKPQQMGRPRKKGKRLSTLQHMLQEPKTAWALLTVPRWYSQYERQVEVVSASCVLVTYPRFFRPPGMLVSCGS